MASLQVGCVVIAALAGACGDNAGVEMFASGQRLRAQYVEFPGGGTLFRGFFDTERGEPCSFRRLAGPSGFDYCLPTNARHAFPFSTRYFADSACTKPALAADQTPTVVVLEPADACETELAVHKLGTRVQMFIKDDDGICSPTSYTGFFQLGAQIPLDKFVAARFEHYTASSRITSLSLVGNDGSRLVVAGWDNVRNERVEASSEFVVAPSSEFADRWMPRGIAYAESDLYADSSCQRLVATKYGNSAHCPVTTVVGGPAVLATAGPRITTNTLFKRDDVAGCVPSMQLSGILSFDIGDPLDRETLASVTTVQHGAGRVRRIDATSPEGTAVVTVESAPLLDTQTNAPCDVLMASDGVARCLPKPAYRGWFADAACSRPVIQSYEAPSELVSFEIGSETDPRFEVRRVGPMHEDLAVYAFVGATCTQVPHGEARYYTLGDSLAPTEFELGIIHD